LASGLERRVGLASGALEADQTGLHCSFSWSFTGLPAVRIIAILAAGSPMRHFASFAAN